MEQQVQGSVILAASGGTGLANVLAQADAIVSIVVGVLSAIGIVYSIVWHRCRIRALRKKKDE